jgi:DNA-binding NtrC family response regulator
MANRSKTVIVAYKQVDGACAAAMALLKYPRAEVVVTSARRIGRTLLDIKARRPPQVLICGVGVACPWDEMARAARALQRSGACVTWHCGRGYLDVRREDFARVSTPAFRDAGSNTQGVCDGLALAEHIRASELLALALHDERIAGEPPAATEAQLFNLDLIHASIAQSLMFGDDEPYARAVGMLATGRPDDDARRWVGVLRRSGVRRMLIGRSQAMQTLREQMRACSRSALPVLVLGESGVGKELVAQHIHAGSSAEGAFVPINCATFTGDSALANSTLFGHCRGAFTGAVADRAGAFVAADGGTLFLDELAELPPDVQAKLLRVIEDGVVTPLGADRAAASVEVRIVAATNADLHALTRRGGFRADLLHRLDTLLLYVPPLRERPDDLGVITDATLADMGDGAPRLTPADRRAMREYDWPGNVRQLIKLLQRMATMGMTMRQAIAQERGTDDGGAGLLPESREDILPMDDVMGIYTTRALALMGGNCNATAKALGLAPNTVRKYKRRGERCFAQRGNEGDRG